MSISNRRGKSVAKLAAALCMLSTGVVPADGSERPKLIKTTSPIRVDPVPVDDGGGTSRFAELGDAELGDAGVVGITDKLSAARTVAPARSAAIVQRTRSPQTQSLRLDAGRGERLTNPLVVDAPPKLRRFRVEDYPLVMPTTDSQSAADEAVVDGQKVLPAQPVAELDAALDVLSVQTNPEPALLGTAINRGFGNLAIDQIGSHLEQPSSPGHTMDYPPLGRFSTDLVLPPGQPLGLHTPGMTSSFREQFGAVDIGHLIEDTPEFVDDAVPALPSPTRSPEADAIARPLQVLGQGVTPQAGAAAMEVALKDRRDGDGRVALEVEELMAASSPQPEPSEPEQDAGTPKPSLAEKFVGWSRRLTSGRTSSQNKSVSARLPSERATGEPSAGEPSAGSTSPRQAAPPSRKRSGGILAQWLNRSR
ncbi:hypothetical protein NZK35_11670 [Stieleria sp. ICT_E10.1]|uniref:hypothetical protein n=1 Tax=Stieleria sedimenti TaxID=2976331 RepID=UPI00217FE1E3|nr:hypothetical protein [Stieleria sedimenti]MCS7467302.1 hypothetical protein [Stieleria sedimenti]